MPPSLAEDNERLRGEIERTIHELDDWKARTADENVAETMHVISQRLRAALGDQSNG